MPIQEFIDFKSKESCCGCGACAQICPAKCIEMLKDQEGFLYPKIDSDRCVSCEQCTYVCPVENVTLTEGTQTVYEAWANKRSVRNDGSSGGMFELLARLCLEDGGTVFGAAFDENLQLRHIGVTKADELKPLCKSKYLQSDTSGIYQDIKALLEQGRKVFFVGTPCQVAGLKRFLKKDHDNLLCADFICHGVPNQQMFDQCIAYEEKLRNGKLTAFQFRVKDGKLKHHHGYRYYIGKKKYEGIFYRFPFYYGFKKHLFLRPACHSCQYSTRKRCSDITLADFWNIEKYDKAARFDKGISMIVLNTAKGEKYFERIKKEIICTQFDMEVAINCNACFKKPTPVPPERTTFFEEYKEKGMEYCIEKYLIPQNIFLKDLFHVIPARIRDKLPWKVQ